ncbi:MAG: efflux RND transporter periplasmic adaptor subunit [Polyangiaceae bacterium]
MITEVSPPSHNPKRSKRWWAAVIVAVGLIVAGVVMSQRSKPATVTAEKPVRDVPVLDGKSISFSAAFAQRAGLKQAQVDRRSLVPRIDVVGTVVFDPAHVNAVGSRNRGFVRRVLKVEGDHVEKGDVLAEIESAELGQAQADVAVMAAHKHAAELNAKREADLLQRSLTTARESEVADATLQEQRAQLSAARQRVAALGGDGTSGVLGVFMLRAPMRGTVVERNLAAGQSVEASANAFKVADLDSVWVELAVFERHIGLIRDRDLVDIAPLSDPHQVIHGYVAHVGEVLDLDTRSAPVRITVDNTKRLLRVGQSVSASIHATGPAREAICIPEQAITYLDGQPTVFVAESETRVLPITVRLGVTDGTYREVLEGLALGQRVITDGVFSLKSELYR